MQTISTASATIGSDAVSRLTNDKPCDLTTTINTVFSKPNGLPADILSTTGALNLQKCQEYSMTEIRQIVAAFGLSVRARSKADLCERLRQKLAERSCNNNMPVPPSVPVNTKSISASAPSTPVPAEPMDVSVVNLTRSTSEPIQATETATAAMAARTTTTTITTTTTTIQTTTTTFPASTSVPIVFGGGPGIGGPAFVGRYPLSDMTAAEIEVAFRILFGRSFGQTGDVKLPEEDDAARRQHASLLFGEVLPDGVIKLLDGGHLDAKNATCLVDLGCGMAKLALQAFLTFPNLITVVGVELCRSRFQEAKKRLSALAVSNPSMLTWQPATDGLTGELRTTDGRTLKVIYGDMFAFDDVKLADIVICETNVPADRHADLAQLVGRCKSGSRVLMYHTLRTMPGVTCAVANDGKNQPPSLVINLRPSYYINDRQNYSGGHDRTTASLRPIAPFDSAVLTSWSREKGHHFDLWLRLS